MHVSSLPFSSWIRFLHHAIGLGLNFHFISAILEYSVACTLCACSKMAVTLVECHTKNTPTKRWNAPQPWCHANEWKCIPQVLNLISLSCSHDIWFLSSLAEPTRSLQLGKGVAPRLWWSLCLGCVSTYFKPRKTLRYVWLCQIEQNCQLLTV